MKYQMYVTDKSVDMRMHIIIEQSNHDTRDGEDLYVLIVNMIYYISPNLLTALAQPPCAELYICVAILV